MLRAKQRLDKYRIERRLGQGGFAVVYQAMDTIEGIRVALKVPDDSHVNDKLLRDFRQEVRTTVRLDHPNILPLKNASFINGHFVLVYPLGERTLDDRLQKRMSFETAMNYSEQMLEAVAYAHRLKIIHCDIKPENLILFPGNRLRLTDFGIAKVAMRTVRGSGTGTVGYMAPEQAMGRPSLRSDVFSLGLILYRMFSGHWVEWPYQWPSVGHRNLRQRAHPDLISILKKALSPDPRKRYRDAEQMLAAFLKVKLRASRWATTQATRRRKAG